MISFSLESAGKMGATKRREMEDRRGQAPFMTFWILFKDVLMWRSLKNFAQNFTFDNRYILHHQSPVIFRREELCNKT